jgi:hypothetical protein
VISKSQSKLVSSTPETGRANSEGTTTIPPGKRLSYCYIDQYGNIFLGRNPNLFLRRLKPIEPIQEGLALFFLLLHTRRIWFVPLEPMTGQQHRMLHYLILRCCPTLQSHQAWFQCLRLYVMPLKPIHKNLLIGFENKKRQSWIT